MPPERLTLSNQGHSTSLQASWRAAPAGNTGYTGTLRETKSQEQVGNVSVGNNWTNVTFEDLVPGRQYTLEMAALAGPYRSSVRSVSEWTCECVTPSPALLQAATRAWPGRAESSWHGSKAERGPCVAGTQGQGWTDRQRMSGRRSRAPGWQRKGPQCRRDPSQNGKTLPNATQQAGWGRTPTSVVGQTFINEFRLFWGLICQGW